MLSEKDIQLIDDYLKGMLSNEDIKKFKERLEKEPEFQKEFDFVSSIGKVYSRKQTQEEIAQIENEILNESSVLSKPKNIFYNYKFAIAASFSLLIVTGYFLFFQSKSSESSYSLAHNEKLNDVNKSEMKTDSKSLDLVGRAPKWKDLEVELRNKSQLYESQFEELFNEPGNSLLQNEIIKNFDNSDRRVIEDNNGLESINELITFLENEFFYEGKVFEIKTIDLLLDSNSLKISKVKIAW